MKRLSLFLSLALFFSGIALGQSTKYKVLHDNPPQPRLNINLEYFHLDMGVKNLDGMSFNVGSFGFFEPVPGLGLQYNLKKSILTLGKLGYKDFPGNLELNLGGYLMPMNTIKVKNTRVVLKTEYKGSEYSTNVSGDRVETRHEEVTFLTLPASRRVMKGVRGGLYFKRGGFLNDDLDLFDEMALTSLGVYGGLSLRSIKNIFVDVEGYGVQFNSIGDDIVLDMLFVPINVFRDLNDDTRPVVSPQVKDALGGFPLGFRIGWYRYQIEQRARTGKKFGMAAGFEAGLKPYQGPFITASLGITIVKN